MAPAIGGSERQLPGQHPICLAEPLARAAPGSRRAAHMQSAGVSGRERAAGDTAAEDQRGPPGTPWPRQDGPLPGDRHNRAAHAPGARRPPGTHPGRALDGGPVHRVPARALPDDRRASALVATSPAEWSGVADVLTPVKDSPDSIPFGAHEA